MITIYSEILWKELKLEGYKIHEESPEETDRLILDWIKNTPLEKVNELLFKKLSPINTITDEGYYDGQFYGVNQREKQDRIKNEDKSPAPDIMLHDCLVLPAFLHIAIKTNFNPDEFRFLAKLLEAYNEKLPKEEKSCSVNNNRSEEL